jgi:hypothetical protein
MLYQDLPELTKSVLPSYILPPKRQNKACMLTINYSTELHQENNNSVALYFVIHTVHVLPGRNLVIILTALSRLHDHFTRVKQCAFP